MIGYGVDAVEFSEYQTEAARTDQRPGDDEAALTFPVVGLASEVGSLVTHFKKRIRDGDAHELFADAVGEELGDVLWYVANLAGKVGLDLDDVAQRNLQKVASRWPREGLQLPMPLYDEGFPAHEHLPRDVVVRFVDETDEAGRTVTRIYRGDEQLGNDLTDNSWEDDDYRFHDALHLTYAAMLGWSPITRFFLGCKRKSNPRVREVEDGGRATVLEEAIAHLTFDYARQERFLAGVKHVDFSLLTTIRRLVAGLEVRDVSAYMWERTILRSYDMWRALHDHGGGNLHLDLGARAIDYGPPAS